MRKLLLPLLLLSSLICLSSYADEKKPAISNKEKSKLIDIFGGKVEKKAPAKEIKQTDKVKEKIREFVKERDLENQKRMEGMSKSELQKFKQDIEAQRSAVREKMKNMTKEEKAKFMKELMQNRSKRKQKK